MVVTGVRARGRNGGRRRVLLAVLMMTTALVSDLSGHPVMTRPAMAQGVMAQAVMAQGPATPSGAERRFDIPAQAMTSALAAFGQQSGLQVTVDGASARDLAAPAVRGVMTPDQALRQLLTGSGLTHRLEDGGTIAIQRTPSQIDGTLMLGPVTVEGSRETAYGPVHGYRALQSATATKTDTPISETPASIQVIGKDLLNDQAAIRLEDVVRNTAGAFALGNDFNVGSQTSLNIRGFAVRDVYKNGTRLSDAGQLTMANVERFEILKGPASLLYGSIAPGGLVNIVTKKPQATAAHEVQLGLGGDGYVNPVFDSTGPLFGGKLLYRFVGSYQDTDSFVDGGEDERVLLAPSLAFVPSDDLRIELEMEYSRYDGRPPLNVPFLDGRPDPRFRIGADYQEDFAFKKTEDLYVRAGADYRFSDSTSANAALMYKQRDLDESTLRFFEGAERSDGSRSRTYTFRDSGNSQVAAEGNLVHKAVIGRTSHKFLLGASWRRFDNDFYEKNVYDAFYAPIAGPGRTGAGEPDISGISPFDATSVLYESGIFLQDEMWIDDRLKLVGTLRHSRIDNRGFRGSYVSDRQKDSAWNPQLGALYKLTPDTAVYASYATSLEPVTGANSSGTPFDPSEGEQFEVGIKQDLFGGRATATVAAYQITQSNVLTPDPTNLSFSIQTGEVRSRGLEAELAGRVTDRLNLHVSAGYIDNEITSSNTPGEQGRRAANVPKFKGGLWMNYDLYREGDRQFTVGGGVFAESGKFADNMNVNALPGYATVDVAASYRFSLGGADLNAQLNLINLFDQDYLLPSFMNGAEMGRPRTVLGRLTAQF